MNQPLANRCDFLFFFDVENGNPNGDPDADNAPRIDPDTNHGLVTDVCLKRKVRNYVDLIYDDRPGRAIYVQERVVLNQRNQRAYDALGLKPEPKKLPKDADKAAALTRWMCDTYYDVRSFGAVMSTEINCGQVRGPVQFSFANSIDPIFPLDVAITRMAVTNEKDADRERTMGRKFIVPYGLYRMEGYVSAALAARTGFSDADLDLLFEALTGAFEHDRSAARGTMCARKLIVFRHDNKLGRAPAHTLFERVEVARRIPDDRQSRRFSDYEITIDDADMPDGVTIEPLI